MAKKNLSREEIELRQTTIDVLARTLPNLEEKEAKIVRKHINRLREDIKEAEERGVDPYIVMGEKYIVNS